MDDRAGSARAGSVPCLATRPVRCRSPRQETRHLEILRSASTSTTRRERSGMPSPRSTRCVTVPIGAIFPRPRRTSSTTSPRGTLPALSWVIPEQPNSDHPDGTRAPDNGPSWVASIVNAVGQIHYWKSTAIFILWDDWGGSTITSRRRSSTTPGASVSAFRQSSSHPTSRPAPFRTRSSSSALLRFIENTYGLASLGTSDARAKSIPAQFPLQSNAAAVFAYPVGTLAPSIPEAVPVVLARRHRITPAARRWPTSWSSEPAVPFNSRSFISSDSASIASSVSQSMPIVSLRNPTKACPWSSGRNSNAAFRPMPCGFLRRSATRSSTRCASGASMTARRAATSSSVSFIRTCYDGTPVGENCMILETSYIHPFSQIGDDVMFWGRVVVNHARVGNHCFLTRAIVIMHPWASAALSVFPTFSTTLRSAKRAWSRVAPT